MPALLHILCADIAQTGMGSFQPGHGGGRTRGLHQKDAGMVSAVFLRVDWIPSFRTVFVTTLALLLAISAITVSAHNPVVSIRFVLLAIYILLLSLAIQQSGIFTARSDRVALGR